MTLQDALFALPAGQIVRVGADSSFIAIDEAKRLPPMIDWWSEQFQKTYGRLAEEARLRAQNLLDNGLRVPGLAELNRLFAEGRGWGGYERKSPPAEEMPWREYADSFLKFQEKHVADLAARIVLSQKAMRRAQRRALNFAPFLGREVVERRFSKEKPDELILIVASCGTGDEGLFRDREEYEEWKRTKTLPQGSQNKLGMTYREGAEA